MARYALLILALLVTGCVALDAAVNTSKAGAAGNDRLLQLTNEALDGTVDFSAGLAPITSEDVAETPDSVALLVSSLLKALHANRFAFHSIVFQLDAGPDPNELSLVPATWPASMEND